MAIPHQAQLAGYGLPLSQTPGTLTVRPLRVPRIARPAPKPVRVMPPLPPGVQPAPNQKGVVRAPTRLRKSPVLESPDPRDAMALIALYARARKLITVTYRKKTEQDKIITRVCEPYSIRVKMTRHNGMTRYFYGFCVPHNEIHSFIIDRIVSVEGTNRRFIPRWKVEF